MKKKVIVIAIVAYCMAPAINGVSPDQAKQYVTTEQTTKGDGLAQLLTELLKLESDQSYDNRPDARQTLLDGIEKLKTNSSFRPALSSYAKYYKQNHPQNIFDIIVSTAQKIETAGFKKAAGSAWEDGTLRFFDQTKALIQSLASATNGISPDQTKQYATEQTTKGDGLAQLLTELLKLESDQFQRRIDDLMSSYPTPIPIKTLNIFSYDNTPDAGQALLDGIEKLKTNSSFRPALSSYAKYYKKNYPQSIFDIIVSTAQKMEAAGFKKAAGNAWEDGTLRFFDQAKALIQSFAPAQK